MSENEDKVFTADYVKELRDENAATRRKLRELEATTKQKDIALEFAKRGIEADPTWINIPDGVSIPEAVDKFVSTFKPAVEQSTAPVIPQTKEYPAALVGDKTNANASSPSAQGAFGGRTLNEVKADPVARKLIQEKYRELVHGSSYDSSQSIYTK